MHTPRNLKITGTEVIASTKISITEDIEDGQAHEHEPNHLLMNRDTFNKLKLQFDLETTSTSTKENHNASKNS